MSFRCKYLSTNSSLRINLRKFFTWVSIISSFKVFLKLQIRLSKQVPPNKKKISKKDKSACLIFNPPKCNILNNIERLISSHTELFYKLISFFKNHFINIKEITVNNEFQNMLTGIKFYFVLQLSSFEIRR